MCPNPVVNNWFQAVHVDIPEVTFILLYTVLFATTTLAEYLYDMQSITFCLQKFKVYEPFKMCIKYLKQSFSSDIKLPSFFTWCHLYDTRLFKFDLQYLKKNS